MNSPDWKPAFEPLRITDFPEEERPSPWPEVLKLAGGGAKAEMTARQVFRELALKALFCTEPGGPFLRNAKDGTLLTLIPEGKFLAGEEKFPVTLPAYYLALHPVTNEQYARFLSEVQPGKADLDRWVLLDSGCFVRQSGRGFEAYGGKEDHPVVCVSWYGAEAYYRWAGLRLPTELEWEKGSRGVDGRTYPWGNEWDETKCRNGANMGRETTSQVWDYPGSRSLWGLYQMSGNIREWCADSHDGGTYNSHKSGNLRPPRLGRSRVARGGSWCNCGEYCFRCAYRGDRGPAYGEYSNGLAYRGHDLGFRCARSVTQREDEREP